MNDLKNKNEIILEEKEQEQKEEITKEEKDDIIKEVNGQNTNENKKNNIKEEKVKDNINIEKQENLKEIIEININEQNKDNKTDENNENIRMKEENEENINKKSIQDEKEKNLKEQNIKDENIIEQKEGIVEGKKEKNINEEENIKEQIQENKKEIIIENMNEKDNIIDEKIKNINNEKEKNIIEIKLKNNEEIIDNNIKDQNIDNKFDEKIQNIKEEDKNKKEVNIIEEDIMDKKEENIKEGKNDNKIEEQKKEDKIDKDIEEEKEENILNEEKNENIKEEKEENKILPKKEEDNNNVFETDLLKYDFDYSTKFNSINYLNLFPTTKQKLLLYIFLMSSKLNFYNKIISLDRLHSIFESEQNINMIYIIISKIMKYIKSKQTSIHMIKTYSFFGPYFFTNAQNYFFIYKIFSDLKKVNKNVSLDINIIKNINEYIEVKINFFQKYFYNSIKSDKNYISKLDKIITNILEQKKEEKEEEENNIDNNLDKNEDEYLFIINKIWLKNANKFIKNYFFAQQIDQSKLFLEEAFAIDNILSRFLSSKGINKLLKGKNFYPYPGPINNFPLIDFKDVLIDPVNKEENIIVKKNVKEEQDFYLIEKKEWHLLKTAFLFTNEIKRKKNEMEMIQIKVIIFDYRIRQFKDESINFMKKKMVQISANKNINDLEQKIIRCMNNEINKIKQKYNKNNDDINLEDINLSLFKVNKNNKDILIEMFLSFINDITPYESIFFQEIFLTSEDKTKPVKEIFCKYNPKKEILIIELTSVKNNVPKFLLPINTDKLLCSICNKEIKDINDTKYMCDLCSMFIFCSRECAKINNEENNNKKLLHFNLHKYLSDLIKRPFYFSEFIQKDFEKEIFIKENEDKSKGKTGLYNLGNTCYMNCSLQCLSNTEDLTKYFLNNYFQNDINLQSKFGSNGVLLKSYSDLLNLMWFSNFSKINPHYFRVAFCYSTQKFANNQQQDAMEFLSILLNYFHEDLNRIREKPYIMLENQKEDESDIQASERYYNYYLQRENSIIIDLFHGQFQNIILCQKCCVENKTYEPFSNVTLPIPEEHNFYIIKFFTHLKCKYITINITSETTFGELIKKATNFLSKKILDAFEEIKKIGGYNPNYMIALLEKNIEIVKLDKNKIINTIYSQPEDENDIPKNYQKKLKKYINQEEEIILFEREIIPDYHQNIYVYPITFDSKEKDKINFLSYPVVFSVKHDLILENFEKIIVDKFSHIFIDNKEINKNNHLIDLYIFHSKKNLNQSFIKIIKDYPKCRFCGRDYSEKKFCALYESFNKNDTIATMFKNSKYSEPLVLLARSSYFDINKEVYPGYYFEENNILNKHKNIYDSLNQFGKYEFLGDDNLWDCPKCAMKTKINKAIKIYKAPNYLIIQLKRFKKKSNGFFNFLEGDKNETFVSFPIKNLDLSNYVEGPGKSESLYDLYAVINHKSIGGCNHFTAFCKNNNRWIEYDDHRINHINNPVTNDAYILFYSKNI